MAERNLLVCCGTGCLANGAREVAEAFEVAVAAANVDATVSTFVKRTGCNGFCENGPIVKVHPDDISYYRVKQKHAEKIVSSLGGEPVTSLLYRGEDKKPVTRQIDNPFYAHQHKIALRNIGEIDPTQIDDYLERGGYAAYTRVITKAILPEEVIQEVIDSGLRGRGGAGFPTGIKWQTAATSGGAGAGTGAGAGAAVGAGGAGAGGAGGLPAAETGCVRYVCCNGDEGDPGAFMDRSILEGDPHSVLEGLAICAYAIGAERGFLYIRDEYGLALQHVSAAIQSAEERGFIGDDILGTGRRLHLEIIRGGGAFVCGESTALMASIEGRVGEPRAKYIRSVQRGLWDRPTVLNNVETLANIPYILTHGGAEYARLGSETSTGTKVFSLVGKVNRTGLVEVDMGATLRHLIFGIGGGIKRNRPFKAVQTGGPSGGCIPEKWLDLAVDFDSLTAKGAMMGSGGMIVMDDHDCMVEVARYYVKFLAEESCGKCTPCREGLRQMLRILTDITEGRGEPSDLEVLERLGRTMQGASLCALGQSAPNPVLSTIEHFRDEYEAHINEHRCPAGVCVALTVYDIDPALCTSCSACARACPVGIIHGEKDKPYQIEGSECIACGSCRESCRFDAVFPRKKEGTEVAV
jgi:NADH-quinone oxidoreductase subunit F